MRLGGQWPEIKIVPLNWDQSHTANVTFTYASPSDWGGSIVAQFGSGTPYTPRQSKNIGTLLTNSETKPTTLNANLRVYKDFALGFFRLSVFGRVYNLFDTRNQLNVYDDTGRADFTLDLLSALRQQPVELVNPVGEWFSNPTFYSEPRRVEVGLTLYFGSQ